jgi:hypothetical protein
MTKVAIIGQGYVGLTIAAFASKTNQVVGFDNSQRVVDQLNQGISHIEGVDSSSIKAAIAAGTYRASSRGGDISDAEIVVIAVPTPLDEERKPDLSFIESACKTIAENISHPVLVINESTSFLSIYLSKKNESELQCNILISLSLQKEFIKEIHLQSSTLHSEWDLLLKISVKAWSERMCPTFVLMKVGSILIIHFSFSLYATNLKIEVHPIIIKSPFLKFLCSSMNLQKID